MAADDRYSGELAEQLTPLQYGILESTESRLQKLSTRKELEQRRMTLLLDHYGIERGPLQWYELALTLARKLVPGLQEERPTGRARKWSDFSRGVLFVEINRIVVSQHCNVEKAAKLISTTYPWQRFVEQWSEDKSSFGPDPAEVLRKQYFLAKKMKFSKVCWDAYLLHAEKGDLPGWQETVAEVLQDPS